MQKPNVCYQECNKLFKPTEPTMRLFCKKGCDADDEKMDDCKFNFCTDLCVKSEIGEEGKELGAWSKFFARSSGNSDDCMKACQSGCINRAEDDD